VRIEFRISPRYACSFDVDAFFIDWYFGINVREVHPNNKAVMGEFEAEYVCAFQWKILVNVAKFETGFIGWDPEDVGAFRVILVLGNVVVNECHLLFRHV
jgi:hypothetical protein